MQITEGRNWLRLVAATAVAGVVIAGALSFTVAPRYVSSAAISITPQADPVRPTSVEALRERTEDNLSQAENIILSRTSLSRVINDPELRLYREELRRRPLDDVIEEMRHNIHIQIRSAPDGEVAPVVCTISFSYPDRVKAQATVRELTRRFTEVNAIANRNRVAMYQGFWGDMSLVANTKPAPPPPTGEVLGVLDTASLPVDSSGSNRAVFLAGGLGAGLALGLLAALAMRWPGGIWQVGGYALAGCVVACALSFAIPNRYTSTAVMEITPALMTEDPMAPLPAATPAADFLRQKVPTVLSVQNLSEGILDPRLLLYPKERATKPMNEVVQRMLGDDLRVTPLNPISGAKGAPTAFSISFSYSDRYQAQRAVQWVISRFQENHAKEVQASMLRANRIVRNLSQRRADQQLEVLDPASLPVEPIAPNRLVMTMMGLGLGLMAGLVRFWLKRPGVPVLQTA